MKGSITFTVKGRLEAVLEAKGYVKHWNENGWVREIRLPHGRFHVYWSGYSEGKIHFDRYTDGFHLATCRLDWLRPEIKRIMK